MARPMKDEREHLVRLLVTLLLDVRRMYLQSTGAKVLTHWDLLQSRMMAATRTCVSVPEWCSKILRGLQIEAPSSSLSASIETLVIAVTEVGEAAFLDLAERECAYVIARARLEAERRRDDRQEQQREQDAALEVLAKNAAAVIKRAPPANVLSSERVAAIFGETFPDRIKENDE